MAHQPNSPVASTTPSVAPPATDPALLGAIASTVARLQTRFPTASPELVQSCVNNVVTHFRGARVHNFLPILMERKASDALLEIVRAGELEV
jgi:hypothetical protein